MVNTSKELKRTWIWKRLRTLVGPWAVCKPSSANVLKDTRSSNSISKTLCSKAELIKRFFRPPSFYPGFTCDSIQAAVITETSVTAAFISLCYTSRTFSFACSSETNTCFPHFSTLPSQCSQSSYPTSLLLVTQPLLLPHWTQTLVPCYQPARCNSKCCFTAFVSMSF